MWLPAIEPWNSSPRKTRGCSSCASSAACLTVRCTQLPYDRRCHIDWISNHARKAALDQSQGGQGIGK